VGLVIGGPVGLAAGVAVGGVMDMNLRNMCGKRFWK